MHRMQTGGHGLRGHGKPRVWIGMWILSNAYENCHTEQKIGAVKSAVHNGRSLEQVTSDVLVLTRIFSCVASERLFIFILNP